MSNGTGSPTDGIDWDALARYLAGESSAEEADAMRRWLGEHPERAQLVTALDRSLDRLAADAPIDVDVEGALRRVRARMHEPDLRVVRPALRPPTFSERPLPVRRIAAIAALAAALAGIALVWRARDRAEDAAPARTLATVVGQLDSLTLADGSRVVLGPASRLVVGDGYGVRHRDVTLEGTARFDVVHRDALPFTVRAGGAIVRDVGTVFIVRTDAGDGVHVAVTSGAVVLRAAASGATADSVLLREGDLGRLEPDGRVIARRSALSDADVAWAGRRIVFTETPLGDVASELRRWYGVTLVADSALARRRVTASFDGESRDEALNVIALTLGARLERRGDTVFLRAAPSSARPR